MKRGAREQAKQRGASRAWETPPSISWHVKGRPSKGIYPRGVSWVSPDEALGEGEGNPDALRGSGGMSGWEPLMGNHDA